MHRPDSEIRLSTAIMHHPSRTELIAHLLGRSASLSPEVVADPEPDGVPSPLRTAKRAWAAVGDDATHHMVLQDDVTPAPGIADHLQAVVSRHPDAGISLCVNWNSPHNSYLVRRAALRGASYAALTYREWVPTFGFILPADLARSMAAYLAEYPDAYRDDDELVAGFCRENGVPVFACLPNLLEHSDLPSVAGNDDHGERLSVLPFDHRPVRTAHWTGPVAPEETALQRGAPRPFAVEMANSRTYLRFLRHEKGEPLEHPFGWPWESWSGLVGVEPSEIAESFEAWSAGRPLPASRETCRELWAAAYLLGRDAASSDTAAKADGDMRTSVLRTWIGCGLTPEDRPESDEELLDLSSAAAHAGASGADESPVPLVEALARRHAEAVTSSAPSMPPLDLVATACPECGRETPLFGAENLPYEDVRVLYGNAERSDRLRLRFLACEVPDTRSMAGLAAKAERLPSPVDLRTRGVRTAESPSGGRALLREMVEDERRWDALEEVKPDATLTVPAFSRSESFLGPHGEGRYAPYLDSVYRRALDDAIRGLF
ncbi:hypothetical protein [Salininema proteolyticum]|uniref:Uncharacterized protein n=1 Tax=Salininema proteolyticum TaxID=1607685 RepID=A0ABV8U2J7_9ACTN